MTLSVNYPFNKEFLKETNQIIIDFENRLTVNRKDSEIMNINDCAGKNSVRVSKSTYILVKKAVEISKRNLGFNVAIGPLVKLWKIGFEGASKPTDDEIKKCLEVISPQKIMLNDVEHTVFLEQAGMELDLGGIAKGYIADQLKVFWKSKGVESGIIDLGGNVLLVGTSEHENGIWKIGVQNPLKARNVPLGILKLQDKSVGTSGIYERKLVVDGNEYHHMLDSKTGYPIKNDLASVTIISDKSIVGEIWSTIAFYKGIDEGKKLIEAQAGIDAVFITRDLHIEITSGLTETFYLNN
ncbi:FAD:protein FMN transferase [Paucilactobacillus oligofermentans]|uniref:FAD:protein FMN transferase n=1 Tax=Paucilactobacillus oligofermentans TaxID=293371 RepID=UPI0030846829